jgi:inner membrane protein involved in colicin E2 resistance
MIKRLFAIGFIFACVSVAWFVLAGATSNRTNSADSSLKSRVSQLWGAPQAQLPPQVTMEEKVRRKVEVTEDGKKVEKFIDDVIAHRIALDSSDIKVDLRLNHRQKGLLWYSTYGVNFEASYVFTNQDSIARDIKIALPFPAEKAVFDDLRFDLDGAKWLSPPVPGEGNVFGWTRLAPGESVTLRVGYRSQGLDRWAYRFGSGVAEVKNFKLMMRTDFDAIDFPEEAISPTAKERHAGGWMLKWEYRRLVSGVNIAMAMPEKLQPGPLASQISAFAPVSLFFFIVVLLTIGVVRNVDIHPMHFFFLAASFFAFHLLFAYLADQVSIHAAFAIAAAVSMLLTISYLRIVFGAAFAFFAAGTAQLVYLVLFSYAFFFKGLTGLAITIGAIATLFVLMQVTARVNWNAVFGERKAVSLPPSPSPAPS